MTMIRPRMRGGANSLTSVEATGKSELRTEADDEAQGDQYCDGQGQRRGAGREPVDEAE